MNKSLNECLTSAIDATTRLAILNLEKDSLNARLGIVRKEIKSAKTLAWTTKRDYTDKYIQQTECQDDFFYTPNRQHLK